MQAQPARVNVVKYTTKFHLWDKPMAKSGVTNESKRELGGEASKYLSEQSYETTGILLNAHVVYLQDWGYLFEGQKTNNQESKKLQSKRQTYHVDPSDVLVWAPSLLEYWLSYGGIRKKWKADQTSSYRLENIEYELDMTWEFERNLLNTEGEAELPDALAFWRPDKLKPPGIIEGF